LTAEGKAVNNNFIGRLAQVDRALVSGTRGRAFESRIAHHEQIFPGCSSLVCISVEPDSQSHPWLFLQKYALTPIRFILSWGEGNLTIVPKLRNPSCKACRCKQSSKDVKDLSFWLNASLSNDFVAPPELLERFFLFGAFFY
jgi:hypothetical protein